MSDNEPGIANDAAPPKGHETTMHGPELSLKDLAVVVPIVGSGFAFAYVVGYFAALNIEWFAFFTLPEHVVFALRAFPIAIGMSVPFLIALRFSELQERWKWLKGTGRWFFPLLWTIVLTLAAIPALRNNHIGIVASSLLIAIGGFVYSRMSSSHIMDFVYWTTTMMVLSLVVGLSSGWWFANSWRYRWVEINLGLPPTHLMRIDLEKEIDHDPAGKAGILYVLGKVIFVGSVGVLFWDDDHRHAVMIRSDNIKDIIECPNDIPCESPVKPKTSPAVQQ
jgi:hypothetical protein